jgi:hypothetical protein
LGTTQNLAQDIRCVPDEKLWQLRQTARSQLVEYARERLSG